MLRTDALIVNLPTFRGFGSDAYRRNTYRKAFRAPVIRSADADRELTLMMPWGMPHLPRDLADIPPQYPQHITVALLGLAEA